MADRSRQRRERDENLREALPLGFERRKELRDVHTSAQPQFGIARWAIRRSERSGLLSKHQTRRSGAHIQALLREAGIAEFLLDALSCELYIVSYMSAATTITLKKWGNSIGLLLPAALAKAAHLSSGNRVEIDVSDETLILRKAPGQSRIEELCSTITPENLHSNTEWGSPQGNEAW